MNKLLTLGLSLEDVIHDYKIVADSITDDKTYQEADVGILLSNLDDVIKWLEELKAYRNIGTVQGYKSAIDAYTEEYNLRKSIEYNLILEEAKIRADEQARIINIIENCCWKDAEMLVELIREQNS